MNQTPKKNRYLHLALLAAAMVVAALALAACGGGSSSDSANVTTDGGVTEIVTASFPGGHDTDEVSPTGAKPMKPCGLVTKAQAEGILGKGVKVSERPQGPTCVYSGSGREVDLVVEKVPLSSLKNGARSVEPVTINGRQGYCLKYGSTSVVVAVGSGRVLQATGPCQAGVRFAAIALKRL
jgi:uncharacterized protein DUF3558